MEIPVGTFRERSGALRLEVPAIMNDIRLDRLIGRVWIWGGVVALVRLGVLWFLIYREWTREASLAILPLVLLLFPEGWLLPAPMTWTTSTALAFSAILAAGSFLWVMIFVLVVGRGRG